MHEFLLPLFCPWRILLHDYYRVDAPESTSLSAAGCLASFYHCMPMAWRTQAKQYVLAGTRAIFDLARMQLSAGDNSSISGPAAPPSLLYVCYIADCAVHVAAAEPITDRDTCRCWWWPSYLSWFVLLQLCAIATEAVAVAMRVPVHVWDSWKQGCCPWRLSSSSTDMEYIGKMRQWFYPVTTDSATVCCKNIH